MLFNISFNKNRQTGFTLIELLVVIAIVGILSTLTVITINSAKTKARDAKRAHDTRQIITALDLYYQEYGFYPKANFNCVIAECSRADPSNFLKPLKDAGYFVQTPVDPLNTGSSTYWYLTYSCGPGGRDTSADTPTYYVLVWTYEIFPETCNLVPISFCPPQILYYQPAGNTACSFNTSL